MNRSTNKSDHPNTGDGRKWKIAILGLSILLTVATHYGYVLEPFFGHTSWVHALHARLCYIPIVIAAAWFGLRGGLLAAAAVSLLIQPYIFILDGHDPAGEFLEILFYFSLAILTGLLIDREARIRQRQENTQRELERSHRLSLIGQMAAGVAHEIKNPLASIKGAIEIITAKSVSDSAREEFGQIAGDEITRIDNTVKEFLNFARPGESQMVRLDMSARVRTTLKQLSTQVESLQIELKSEIDDNLFVSGDSEQLHQVILNLVLNAFEASHENDTVTVTLRSEGFDLLLLINDTGDGMDKDEVNHIFDPFWTTKSTGTGLGLATVKSIIERHNGRIKVESERGSGTSLSVYLPISRTNYEV